MNEFKGYNSEWFMRIKNGMALFDCMGEGFEHYQFAECVVALDCGEISDRMMSNAKLISVAPQMLDSLVWSLQLAEVALEDCRINRIRCGHLDIVSKYKDGRVCIGLYQDEVDKLESAKEVLRKVLD